MKSSPRNRREQSTLGKAAPTLGLLVDWLQGDYQNTILRGIADAAKERSVNLICFTGGALRAPYRRSRQRNAIYALAGTWNVDALMVVSGTLGNHVGHRELTQFCTEFNVPVCSIAVRLPGFPSILVDNESGIREALTHLARDHGHRRIAFIRGPAANPEAERRYLAYQDVLEDYGIELDEALVFEGDFQPGSGAEAIREFYEERRVAPDAIVAANDQMALDALAALHARNIRVPEQVAVVGFDDGEEARFSSPPLATVRQPLYEQGQQAVRVALAQINGEHLADEVMLHTNFVRRRSCGCYGHRSTDVIVRGREEPTDFASALARRRDLITAALSRAAHAAIPSMGDWENHLVDAFAHEFGNERGHTFTDRLYDVLRSVDESHGDLAAWHDVLSSFRIQIMPCFGGDMSARSRAEDILQHARVLTGNVIESAQARARLQVQHWARMLSESGANLMGTFDLVALRDVIQTEFPRLGIRTCFVCLYEPGNTAQCKLVIAYGQDAGVAGLQSEQPFEAAQLLPAGAWPTDRPFVCIVEPLFFKETELGFAIIERGPNEGIVYEAIRDHLSAAIQGCRLVQSLRSRPSERPIPLHTPRATE